MGNNNKNPANTVSFYDKTPFIEVDEKEEDSVSGWGKIVECLKKQIEDLKEPELVVSINHYPGVNEEELFQYLILPLAIPDSFNTNDLYKEEARIKQLTFPDEKHDHFLIPAGTVHCSGANCMVLEISATPYIFTFKLWDWGRMDLEGKPRPINIDHGKKVIDWSRTEEWANQNLINTIEKVAEGNGWVEEKTGLHEREFIETRRHWFSKPVHHRANGSVCVFNLIEGKEVIIESPNDRFKPFVVHYAETSIIPASIEEYTIRPHGESAGHLVGTIKAFVRHNS